MLLVQVVPPPPPAPLPPLAPLLRALLRLPLATSSRWVPVRLPSSRCVFSLATQAAAAQNAAAATGGPFDFLRQHPQFNALRQLVQQNPALLQPVLQQLAQSNPQILQLINQNQADFIRLLNEPVPPGAAYVALSRARPSPPYISAVLLSPAWAAWAALALVAVALVLSTSR